MDIFENTAQAVRFAFVLDQYIGARSSMVRVALADAGITLPVPTSKEQLFEINAYATQLRGAINDLLGYERSSLIAAYSRNWPERRAAAEALGPFHAHLLARLLDNRTLIGKLVTRHYIAERERGASWALQSLADEHKAAGDRVKRAARLIDENARKLEAIALVGLRIAMENKEPAHVPA
jgi:hypothetical protein